MSSVWVLCPGGKQVKVSVSPTKTVLSVIEEAASKSGVSACDYDLITSIQRRPIDAAQQWRFTSIANNAKLELVPVTKARASGAVKVRVAIQSPTGRLTGQCLTSMTLYEVTKELKLELPEPDQFPVVSFSGKECPLGSSLKEIGVLKGSVLLRVHFRPITETDRELVTTIEDKMKKSPEPTKSTEPKPKVPKLETKTEPTKTTSDRLPSGAKAEFNDFKFPESRQEKMETEEPKEERLPCGMKSEFASFSFDQPVTETTDDQPGPSRLPNGQRAQFNNFAFDNKPASTKKKTTKKEEEYPFKDFKFPEKKTSSSKPLKMEVEKEENEEEPPEVIVPEDRGLRVYDAAEIAASGTEDVSDDFFNVTVDDLKRMGVGAAKEDAPLLTHKSRERRKAKQRASDYANYPVCRVKFNLPNQGLDF